MNSSQDNVNGFLIIVMKVLFGLIIIGSIAFSYHLGASKTQEKEEIESTKTIEVLKYDTVQHQTTVNKWHEKVVHDTLPNKIDTTEIIKKYFSTHYIHRELGDTNITASIEDTVRQNTLIPGKLNYKWLKPERVSYITNTEVVKAKKQIYASAFMYTNKGYNAFGLSANFVNNKIIYGAGCDFFNKGVYAQLGFNLYSK